MIPGMNSRQIKMMMKRMGVQQIDIDALEVIIKTEDKDIIIQNPSVSKINMGGQETFQIMGHAIEQKRETTPSISEEDVKTVMDQAHVGRDQAEQAIQEASGDLAEAILKLKS